MATSQYPDIKTDADVSKLYSESLQLRNRQFVLSTVGITSTGLSSWLISSTDTFQSQAIATVFILVMLVVLFTWSFFLRCRIGQISHYLDLRGASEWEPLFRDFSTRKGTKYISQSVAVMVLYLLLGSLVLTRYLVLSTGPISSPFTLAAIALAFVLVTTTVYLTLTRQSYDKKARENWKIVLEQHFSQAAEGRDDGDSEHGT